VGLNESVLFYISDLYFGFYENRLRIFERKIVRKIYGPIQEGDTWRIRNNEEMNRSINGDDIVKIIKSQSI
jgi:hypothetical protein